MMAADAEPVYKEPPPRYLRAAYLSPGEAMLRETRATRLYYLPAPVFWLVVVGFLDYAIATARWGWPRVPLVTDAFVWLANEVGAEPMRYLAYFFAFVSVGLVVWLLVRYLRWMRTVYAVTTNRVIVQRGLVSRDFDEIPVTRVRAVDVHQSGFQRLLGYGTVRISSEGDNRIANEAWRGVPKPWEFSKLVDAAAQRYTQPVRS